MRERREGGEGGEQLVSVNTVSLKREVAHWVNFLLRSWALLDKHRYSLCHSGLFQDTAQLVGLLQQFFQMSRFNVLTQKSWNLTLL